MVSNVVLDVDTEYSFTLRVFRGGLGAYKSKVYNSFLALSKENPWTSHGVSVTSLYTPSSCRNITEVTMPPSGERSNRKGQYSCNFCRTRKLRCDRPLPCTICRSHGKTCQFEPTLAALKAHEPNMPDSMVNGLQQEQQSQQQTPHLSSKPDQVNLLAELHAL
jgi:hypothetical protein